MAKARFVRIGAAALGAGVAGITTTWAADLRMVLIAPVTAMLGTTMTTALVAAVVIFPLTAHQIAQHPFKKSHDLFL